MRPQRAPTKMFNRLLERAQPGGEAGFTLIELIVVSLLVSVVSAALMAPLVFSAKTQSKQTDYALAQQEARAAIESIVAQVRSARAINSSVDLQAAPNAQVNSIDMNLNQGGTDYHVVYECDITQPGTNGLYRECVRAQAAIGQAVSISTGTVVARDVINGTLSDPVFTLGPSAVAPYYMQMTLKVPANGGTSATGGIAGAAYNGMQHTLVFSDGALMRNLNVLN